MSLKILQSSAGWMQKGLKATIPLPLTSFTEEDGTPLTIAGADSGFSQLSNKESAITIPVNGAIVAFASSFSLPQDTDYTQDVTIHALVGKDAANDDLTLDCEVYPVAESDSGNDDIQDTATQTVPQAVTELVYTCGADGVLAPPATLSAIFTLGGTNDGDAVYIYGAWAEYYLASPIGQATVHCCRVIVPEAHRLSAATAWFQNVATVGTVTCKLKQSDTGDARTGALVGAALNNATLMDYASVSTKYDFSLAATDKAIAPANRMYFLTLAGTDPADRLDEPILMITYDDEV